jgi:hypothetical protein
MDTNGVHNRQYIIDDRRLMGMLQFFPVRQGSVE